ncbi:MAG TPA: LysE family transporter [Puia sp.]|nr:LysE family transporter [Puia sp.]
MANSNYQKITSGLKLLLAGWLISFLGSLPPGTMNMAATFISLEKGSGAGLMYALGSMLVEIIIVRIVLEAMHWLARHHKLFRLLELFTIGLILALATGSLLSVNNKTGLANSFAGNLIPPFWEGAVLSVTNPLHIPFWLGWSAFLLQKNILKSSPHQYNTYVTGIGVGTMTGFAVFIYSGQLFVSRISAHAGIFNFSVGIVLLITAFFQIRKLILTPSSFRYAEISNNR